MCECMVTKLYKCTWVKRWQYRFMCNIGLKQGCLASPKLLSIFINTLVRYLQNSEASGIQLQPGDDEICSIMFADDVALIEDTVSGLQKQLNALKYFAKIIC